LVLSDYAFVYLAAVLEYMTAELLEQCGNAASGFQKRRITPRHIMRLCAAMKSCASLQAFRGWCRANHPRGTEALAGQVRKSESKAVGYTT
jgi:hypothetical protein